MIFFVGMHQPANCALVPAAMISINRLATRRSGFPCRRVLIDSGAFSELALYGGYRTPPSHYATQLRRWHETLGRRLVGAVAQDYMCEKFMLGRTGLTVAEHQRLTIERYDDLLAAGTGVRIMPVLQGYRPDEYVRHLDDYGARLAPRAWVGVGSVCKRNARPGAVADVLLAIKRKRPDLRLHAFGIKLTALGSASVRDLLFSADSMAWSYHARRNRQDSNDPIEAARYARRVAHQPVQMHLGDW